MIVLLMTGKKGETCQSCGEIKTKSYTQTGSEMRKPLSITVKGHKQSMLPKQRWQITNKPSTMYCHNMKSPQRDGMGEAISSVHPEKQLQLEANSCEPTACE